MKVSEVILRYLADYGVKYAFGIPSGTTAYLCDSINDVKEIQYIIPKNEAAASYSACKYAKISQSLGLCILAGSVGTGNAINGIAEAAQDCVPLLVLTGSVHQQQKDIGAIQDLDSKNLLKRIVKYTVKIAHEKDAIKELCKAMEIAMTYPRGPVNVEIPLNIQREEFTGEYFAYQNPRELVPDYESMDKAIDLINNTEKGLIIVGGACRGMGESIKALAEKLNWRLITTPGGKGVVEEGFRLSMGDYGFPGTDLAIGYVENGDYECILALGSRLGEVDTGSFNKNLGGKRLIHLHTDKTAFNRAYKAEICIAGNLEMTINYMQLNVNQKHINNDVQESLNKPYVKNHTGMSLRLFYENIANYLPQNTFYLNDIGETLVFAHKYFAIPKTSDYECNITYGCMGSSVGALGVSCIDPRRQVAVFAGDGSFYMNIMSELLTAKKYNMKIIVFVINNSSLAFVGRGLTMICGRVSQEVYNEYVDISNVVQAMGIPAIKITDFDEMKKLGDFIKDINGPQVVEVVTDLSEPIPTNRFKTLKQG